MSIDDPIFKMRSWIFLGNICSMGTTCKSIFGFFFSVFIFFHFRPDIFFRFFVVFFKKIRNLYYGENQFFLWIFVLDSFQTLYIFRFFSFFLVKIEILYYWENEVFQHVSEFCWFPTWYIFLIIFVFFPKIGILKHGENEVFLGFSPKKSI